MLGSGGAKTSPLPRRLLKTRSTKTVYCQTPRYNKKCLQLKGITSISFPWRASNKNCLTIPLQKRHLVPHGGGSRMQPPLASLGGDAGGSYENGYRHRPQNLAAYPHRCSIQTSLMSPFSSAARTQNSDLLPGWPGSNCTRASVYTICDVTSKWRTSRVAI